MTKPDDGGRLEAEGLRKLVLFGVALTTLAAMSSVVVVPVVYNCRRECKMNWIFVELAVGIFGVK
jgi:hypothetical protein